MKVATALSVLCLGLTLKWRTDSHLLTDLMSIADVGNALGLYYRRISSAQGRVLLSFLHKSSVIVTRVRLPLLNVITALLSFSVQPHELNSYNS